MISKVFICPYFGDLPPWIGQWRKNTERMRQHGYDFLFDDDEEAFGTRVRRVLGIECPPMAGTGNVHNFRPALGLLYADEIAGFDYWGHTDFDCVYGRVERWMTEGFLAGLDVFSNHDDYISGPWTLYRNTPLVRSLFLRTDEWVARMSQEDTWGWAEKGFTYIVDEAHDDGEINRCYAKWQSRYPHDFSKLRLRPNGALLEEGREIMMSHFRHVKEWPAGCYL